MIYIKVANEHAENLSRAIMRLMRPSHLRKAQDVTDMYCQVLSHPATGETALAVPEEERIPIHLKADGNELIEMLSVFVQDDALTQAEADAVAAAVVANAGKRVSLNDFVPPSWQANVLTQDDADAAGWRDSAD